MTRNDVGLKVTYHVDFQCITFLVVILRIETEVHPRHTNSYHSASISPRLANIIAIRVVSHEPFVVPASILARSAIT